ncbi:BON domain-containing protein [Cupriavidus necator]|uniref:BON domain-containing protein n=1 Tax=Cupriavidus necator TaxID=106590 RepID=A0A1U9UNG9_CUPNE|nr:BON domain-containing protein [Cupriavidus necator]AQV94274.1 BON domain-containing protein [Cupriavidus necator]
MKKIRLIGFSVLLASAIVPILAVAQNDEGNAATASATADRASNPSESRAANRALAKSVRLALAKAKGIPMTHLFVYAKDGVVTLSGAVPDKSQVDRAGAIAKGVTGVSSVENRLSVYSIDQQ